MCDFQLVGPGHLEQCLGGDIGGARWVLLEAHFTSIDHPLDPDRPNRQHIPGAIQVHPSYLEAGTDRSKYYPFYDCPTDGNLLAGEKLVTVLERIAISADTLVVVYGTEPDGTMAAARLIWGLMVAGVRAIRLLDGGLDRWLAHGGATVSQIEEASELAAKRGPAIGTNAEWRPRREFLTPTEAVREIARCPGDGASKLIDVRQLGEWDGSVTNFYPFFSKAGHIPNAIYQGDWDTLLDMDTHQLRPRLEAVARRWRMSGIVDPGVEEGRTTLVFYCGTGWRSSISFLVALLLGFRASNYDDGFYGWSWDEANEIAYGGAGVKGECGPGKEGSFRPVSGEKRP